VDSPTEPRYKHVNPTPAFDTLVGAVPGQARFDAEKSAQGQTRRAKERARRRAGEARRSQPKPATRAQQRWTSSLQSVREVELKTRHDVPGGARSLASRRPNFIARGQGTEFRKQ